MRWLRRSSPLVAAAMIALVIGSVPVAKASAPGGSTAGSTAVAGIDWTTCSDPLLVQLKAQCGFVTVPLDYARPHGATIELAVSRILHTARPGAYQGVVITNPGGPGGSGLELSYLGQLVPDGVGADYDWIGFDPRGVGSSRPALSCEPDYFGPDRPNYVPTSSKDLRVWLDRSSNYAKACRAALPALLQHMHTVDQARDVDSIRQALGVATFTYYGYSYGTYLGSVYNTLFPGRLRRAVLDSNIDPRYVWYEVQLHQDQAEENSLRQFWSWVAQHNDVYQLGATELAVEQHYFDLRARLLVRPAAGIVGPDELDDAFDLAAYDPQYYWPYLAEDWANYVHHGDTHYLVLDYQAADNPGNDNEFAVYNATQCTDAPWPTPGQQLADAYRIQPAASFYTWTNFWFNAPCLNWPVPSGTPIQIHGGSLAPLILDDYADGPTPYAGDLEVRRLYPNGRLIGAPGSNHGVSLGYGNSCFDIAVAAYLATGALPPRRTGNATDATCPAMPTPVPVTYPGTPSPGQTAAAAVSRPATDPVREKRQSASVHR